MFNMITKYLIKTKGYLYLILVYCILFSFIYTINLLLLYVIPNYILLILLDIIIVVIQTDNFSLYYDYLNLKEYYTKLKNDEYRINKLTKISNNLLKIYDNLQEDYFELLLEYDTNYEIFGKNINKIKLLNIEMCKYKSLYNRIENKLIYHNKITRSKSLNSISLEFKLFDYNENLINIESSLNLELKKSIQIKILKKTKCSLNLELEKSIPVEIFKKIKSQELYNKCSINAV